MSELTSGVQLGPYEIVAAIGAGGMGEVYKATDTRLGRTVAVKVLGAGVSDAPAARERFELEARAISQLNHPHICTLYDVGSHQEIDYLMMEYLEGETLASVIGRGPLPLNDALTFAIQIGEALDNAHRHGVAHRDLKPGNVMLTRNGAKLLDFGLAKLLHAPESAVPVSVSAMPTNAPMLTGAGAIVGTLQYMSPEQLEGKVADARSDIFAFGATLYEMLTGQKAFDGKTQVSLMAAILEHDPVPAGSLRESLPKELETLVNTCLIKDPEERWQTARDLVRQLKSIRTGGTQSVGAAAAVRGRRSPQTFFAGFAVAAILALAIWGGLRHRSPTPSVPAVVRFDVLPPEGTGLVGDPPRFSISPDGRYIVFAARGANSAERLWIRRLDSTEVRPVAGSEVKGSDTAPQSPFWSPDSKSLAFFSSSQLQSGGAVGKLKRTGIEGGAAETIAEIAGNNLGGTWNEDGTMLIASSELKGIQRIPSTGGVPVQVTTLQSNEQAHLWPQFLPDGRHFIYQAQGDRGRAMYVGVLDSQVRKPLVESQFAQFAMPDQVLFTRSDALLAQTIDLKSHTLTGEPRLISKSLRLNNPGNGRAAFFVSQTGVLVYADTPANLLSQAGQRPLVWIDRTGKTSEPVGGVPNTSAFSIQLSPQGHAVAFSDRVGERDVFVLDLDRKVTSRLTTDPSTSVSPVWTPDGKYVIWGSRGENKGPAILTKAADGAVKEEVLFRDEELAAFLIPLQVSADGNWLIFLRGKSGVGDIWRLPLKGDRKPVPYLTSVFAMDARLTPDGKWLAYSSTASGRNEVFVQPFPDPSGGKWQISANGGRFPNWGKGGKEIFYIDLEAHMVTVSVATNGGFQIGQKTTLFDAPIPPPAVLAESAIPYDIASDGRFLFAATPLTVSASGQVTPLKVLVNWPSLFK